MAGSGSAHDVAELDVVFHAVDGGDDVASRAPEMFEVGWPAYRRWYLRDGEEARPTYAECHRQLRRHLPELLPDYERLVDAVGGGDLEARFLSHWQPPPLFGACSLATWTNGSNLLVRNYDYPPQLCDATLLASRWGGTRVLGMSDCVLGLLDGVNEHGLSAAIAFGGRPVVGHGFGVGIIVRYVLQAAADVGEALAILDRVPVQVSYNIALVDCSGAAAIAYVAPDRAMAVSRLGVAGNRQGATEWTEHARFCATEEREAALAAAMAEEGMTASGLVATFLREPVYRPVDDAPWGTLYTGVYSCDLPSVDLVWPDETWRIGLDGFVEGRRARRLRVAVPPAEHIPVPAVAHGRPLLIV
ncbi:MAG: C45 family autoproteolytic acyltransferase/hydrolase [Actinomycetota bacterium]|nr:C45 family autoproteolytic acyltransferase/hydrolase [Actinomycetota bacterium]MDH4352720.1 C45 family autoproteolytic acyltransferase/hydrolase [Actinomycetota bacterium]MDH5277887.1 C45 family autoproteolytic acyltransferase/hydrolase [Actinomycetota bacterium]